MKDLENKLKSIPPRRPSPDFYRRVLDQKPISQDTQTKAHRFLPNRLLPAVAALAACLIMALTLWRLTAGNGAQKAFAAAMDSIKQARTFSCINISEFSVNGQPRTQERVHMFKEPDLERYEFRTYFAGVLEREEIGITDYAHHQRLKLDGIKGQAELYDNCKKYIVDSDTGELELEEVKYSSYYNIREEVIKLGERGAVEDLGMVELEGRTVRKLQAEQEHYNTTVWIDPQSNLPVQIERIGNWTDNRREIYASIQIDVELDDALFSLEPPEGYSLEVFSKDWPDDKMKILGKMQYLQRLFFMYANEHKDQYPDELAELVAKDYLTDEVLQVVQAPLEEPGGPAVIRYCKPKSWGPTEVVFYETYEPGSDDGVVVSFYNANYDIIPVKTLEQLLKPRTNDKEKISASMIYLQLWCANFARRHQGQYPRELADLEGFDDYSKRLLKFLQVAPGGDVDDGPPVIRYRRPRADAEPSTEITFYEIVDQWPADGAAVCFMNGLCEIITDQKHFEELIR